MADLLELSARAIADGTPVRWGERMDQSLSEVGDRVAVIESFSHVVILRTDAGLVLFDTSVEGLADRCVTSLRAWSDEPIAAIVYTHGHIDHVGGSGAFLADNEARGYARPEVLGHENVQPRFDRYRFTDGYNRLVNGRQFGRSNMMGDEPDEPDFLPASVAPVDRSFRDRLEVRVGDTIVELRHDRGETDDHAWAWLPAERAVFVGDLLTWVFPNAGNPQKVQRYPLEWAAALRSMAALEPELLVPAHGLPIGGCERIAGVLDDVASVLEGLVRDVVGLMNEGQTLDTIVAEVDVAPELLAKPYLLPTYDEPEFVVRNIWRLYGGWYDGNPSRLKPAPDAAVAAELAALAGGVGPLVARARALADAGDHRVACHLVELAVQAAPDHRDAHGARAEIYAARRRTESSLMAKGIYGAAAAESAALLDD